MGTRAEGVAGAGWERAVARILDPDTPIGVAVLIPGGYLLTCAHVIAGVIGARQDEPLPTGTPVWLDFPLADGRPRARARLVFSVPVAADNTGDLAVLELDQPPPADARPVRILDTDDVAGHSWRAFGFPRYRDGGGAKDSGIWTSGRIEGREGTGWWQLTVRSPTGFGLAEGFSGAPVWDVQLGCVIGVLVAVEADTRRATGYALTVGSVLELWPRLRSALLAGCPYRGLSAFTEHDHAVFFGRELEATRLVEQVEVDRAAIVPVLGSSGVGKSSLVWAGLVARLGGEYLVGRVPHNAAHSAEELLAWALAEAGTGDRDGDEAAWHRRWRGLADLLAEEGGVDIAVDRSLARAGRTRLLLVVDQFEVLLAEAPRLAHRLDALLAVVTGRRRDGTRPAQAVVVARIDALRQLESLANLWAAWNATPMVVPPLTRGQLRDVIEAPLRGLGGVRFTPGLVDRILDDTPTGPGALPLLEYLLAWLWERQSHGELTATAYQTAGGVGGALSRAAEANLWSRADATERGILERVFIQLVRPGELLDAGERTPDTRRTAGRAEFDEASWTVIQRLASTRLVVVTRQPTGTETVELTHEALVGSWPRLAGWIEANRDFRTWQEGVRRALRDWLGHDREDALLLDGARLVEAGRWLERRPGEIASTEVEFIRAGEGRAARLRRRRRTRYSAVALVAALAVASAGVAVQQHLSAGPQRSGNLSRQTVALAAGLDASQPNIAKQLRVAAYRIAPTPEAFGALSTGLPLAGTVSAPGVTRLASGDGVLAIAAGTRVRLWGTDRHTDLASLPVPGGASAVAWRGSLVAVGSADGSIRLWDASRPDRPAALGTVTGSRGPVEQVAFDPHGAVLASGGWDHTVRLWSLADPRHPAPLAVRDAGPAVVDDVAFSADGRLLASAGWDQTVRLWDVSAPAATGQLARIDLASTPRCLAFDPAGDVLAAGDDDGGIHLWSVADPRRPAVLPALSKSGTDGAGSSTVAAVAFSPTGAMLAATGSDPDSTFLWDVSDPGHATALPTLGGGAGALAFDAGGRVLATLDRAGRAGRSTDDEVQLWDVQNPVLPTSEATLPTDGQGVAAATLLTGGRAAVVVSGLNANLWDLADASHPRLVRLLSADASSASGAGTLVAVGGDNTVALWNLADPDRPVKVAEVPIGGPGRDEPTPAVGLSPDAGRLAVLGLVSSTMWLFDVSDPAHPRSLATVGHVPGGIPAFGPHGETLLVTHDAWVDGETSVTTAWDLRDPAHPVRADRLTAALGAPTATALDPTGPLLATSDTDGTVTLWSVADAARPSRIATMSGARAAEDSLRFSPDGRALVGADLRGNFRLWNVTEPDRPVDIGEFTTPSPSDLGLLSATADIGPARDGGGHTVVGGTSDSDAQVWDTDAGDLLRRICASTGDPITPDQWREYLPGAPYAPPCPAAH